MADAGLSERDDRRHPPPPGQEGRDSLFFNLNVMFWVARGEPGVNGYVLREGVAVPIVDGRAHAEYDDDMAQRRLEATIIDASGATTTLEMDRYGVVRFPATGGNDVFEAACTARINGEPGSGQYESLWPTEYVQRLIKPDG